MVSGALIAKRKQESEQEIYLRLLERVAEDGELSQGKFADQIGIAKGLANTYFNRCVSKGWIKLKLAPRKRYLYYLTPTGFSEKARLTAKFLTHSYKFYRDARADLVAIMTEASNRGHHRLGVLGTGELAEIAAITSPEANVKIVGFVADAETREKIGGIPVKASWSEIAKADGALLASVEHAHELHAGMQKHHPDVTIYVPRQLTALLWD